MMFDCYLLEYLEATDYKRILHLQQQIRSIKEKKADFPDFLMVLQHNNVFTLGRNANEANILVSKQIAKEKGIDIIKVDRGGDVTYHGPGQLVGYFLLNLTKLGISIKDFVWKMEEVLIQTLVNFNIIGFRLKGYPGVWVNKDNTLKKIAAVGARASHMITSHGVALNVNTDMEFFKLIVPCGIKRYPPTSMRELLGKKVDMHKVYAFFESAFSAVFNANLKKISEEELSNIISGVV